MRPLLDKMKSHLEVKTFDSETIKEMKALMSANLAKRYQDVQTKELIDVATVFDPRNRGNKMYFSTEIQELVIQKTVLLRSLGMKFQRVKTCKYYFMIVHTLRRNHINTNKNNLVHTLIVGRICNIIVHFLIEACNF